MAASTRLSRRVFGASLLASSAFGAARSSGRVLGANDRINVGFIGPGNRNFGHLRYVQDEGAKQGKLRVAAACDVYRMRNQRAANYAKLDSGQVFADYREMLERSELDAVFIGTPDHWHAQMAIDAMAAGKDVYLEKPMTLTIPEARAVRDAAKKYGRILQVGSQHASNPRYQAARKAIEAGEIGELLWAQATYSRNSTLGEWNYHIEEEGTPENIDWKRWLGPAPKRPFSQDRYFRWRKYWDYSGGIATDLFYHRLTPLMIAMGPQLPVRVTGSGGIYVQKDREVPDTYATVIEYPDFYVNLSSSMANAAAQKYFPEVIYGHKGTLVFEGERVAVYPESALMKGEPKYIDAPATGDLAAIHRENFFSCMRTRQAPALGPELGYQMMVAIKLGVDSYREGRVKHWDPQADREVSSPAQRPGYEGDGKNHGQRRRG